MRVSLGIITCRDRENIPELLRSISSQKLKRVRISEILIVAPDEDKSCITQALGAWKKRKARLINEGKRIGKYAAVNLFLKKAKSDVLALCSGDRGAGRARGDLLSVLKDGDLGRARARPAARIHEIEAGLALLPEELDIPDADCRGCIRGRNLDDEQVEKESNDEAGQHQRDNHTVRRTFWNCLLRSLFSGALLF